MLLDRIKNFIREQYPNKEILADFDLLRLRSINVDKSAKTAKYSLSYPFELSDAREKELINYIKEFSPIGFKVLLEMQLDKMDAEIATRMLWDF